MPTSFCEYLRLWLLKHSYWFFMGIKVGLELGDNKFLAGVKVKGLSILRLAFN